MQNIISILHYTCKQTLKLTGHLDQRISGDSSRLLEQARQFGILQEEECSVHKNLHTI